MKKIKNITSDNCLETSSECVTLAVPLPYLGLCKGDSLTQFTIEIVKKLEEIAGEDISGFDLDALLNICNLKAPLETTIISILTLVKDNQVCLKDFLVQLEERLNALSTSTKVNANLKCYADFDNIGNPLSITRDQLDQLVINELCDHSIKITSIQGDIVTIKNDIANIDVNPVVLEPEFATCVDAGTKSTSLQVQSIASDYCIQKTAIGDDTDISNALNRTPSTDLARYGALPSPLNTWIPVPTNWAENYNNLLIKVAKLEIDLRDIQENCCAPTCDKILIGYSILLDTGNDYIIRFRASDGNVIPTGFTDAGSTVYFKDVDGIRYPISGTLPIDVTEEESDPYDLSSLNTASPITVYVNAKVTNGSLQCDKCTSMTFNLVNDSCPVCQITTSGTGTVTVVYEIPDTIPLS
jgi:hypothetical protein